MRSSHSFAVSASNSRYKGQNTCAWESGSARARPIRAALFARMSVRASARALSSEVSGAGACKAASIRSVASMGLLRRCLERFGEVEVDAARVAARADIDPDVGAWLQLEAVSHTPVGNNAAEMREICPQRPGSSPDDEPVTRKTAVAPQKHLPVFDEPDQRRPIPKSPFDIAAQVIAGPHERQFGPRDVVRADAGLELPRQRPAVAAQRAVMPEIEQVGLIGIVPAHEAAERHCRQ